MLILCTLLANAIIAAPPQQVSPQPKTAMRSAFDSLTTLVWLTATPPAPEKDGDVARELKVLEKAPHVFDGSAAAKEPGLAAIATLLSSYATQTRTRLERGERDTIGYRVRTMAAFCFACHSREGVPLDFSDKDERWAQLPLSPLERARVLAATRQFELALSTYQKLLGTPDAERATEEALVVLVRVKNDAKATDEFLALAGASPRVTAWRAEVKTWAAEKTALSALPLDQLLKKSDELIATKGDVATLRAAAALTHALSRKPTAAQRGEALYLLGLASGGLRSPLLWDLDLLYLEACVRESPKTPLAKKCFGRFEDRLTLGFTGSGGTRIPPDEQQRLEALRALTK